MDMAIENRNAARTAPRRRKRRETRAQRAVRFIRRNAAPLLVGALVLAGIVIGSVATSFVKDLAARNSVRDYGRELKYSTYVVQSGDTMWDISVDMAALNPEFQDVRQYLALLQRTNHIYGDYLQSGTTIMIPYYDAGDGIPMLDVYLKYGIADYDQWRGMLAGD